MRKNLRVKMDFSQIFQDARQLSWVYIDSTKIFYVYQFAEHVRRIFEIKKPFHFVSKHEEMYLFLPLQEDIRILENNDTVIIVPGTGIVDSCETNDEEESLQRKQNGFATPVILEENETITTSDKFYTLTSSINNTDESLKDDNISTASILSKKKRIRKKRQKKFVTLSPENEVSYTEYSGKKPKIIDSVLISSGKHIRFKNLDDEDTASETKHSIQENQVNYEGTNKQIVNGHLNALLNLRQSSTPITFGYTKIKNKVKPEVIKEHSLHLSKPEKTNDNENSNENITCNNIISFMVYRMENDYTPQLSDVIIAKILSYDATKLQYTLKILRGKDQLQEPEGKFSLPKDEECTNAEDTDIVTFNKSELIDLKIVTDYEKSF
ncbi:PREDICTED: uncharacterized protein LOC105364288 [Ceratosolen solmsi marchali]|uniref:Uncharacterized protein LOC105364288 n=1 Tax=Ceratosolen solmsi marchali TaxID=326594 RepID=A0AAJ6YLW4_9HYME|nr:PREDICTED: uncharacterized protein LOC105364288 [Ceratosolen solmsi marchali]